MEGGVTGVRAKAVKRSADLASKSARRRMTTAAKGATDSLMSDLGLLSRSEWGLTLGALALVVLLAVGTQLAGPPKSFADLSTKDQLERLNGAEEPIVLFGRAGFKI